MECRTDIFVSFHGSEELKMVMGKPTMRDFVKYHLLPAIHKQWNTFWPDMGLMVFFDEYEAKDKILDDIIAGIYCLQVSRNSYLLGDSNDIFNK